ncbi:unnamed protein product [Owenia fusiformis]|uniref:Uncharacterized protein n=1 Tax=Owenia fusiformis TaxID=6347 RepID=A0A8J1U8V1_OWEFU|nr:unnamed protein product [Owenia fusiformis]
MLVIKTLSIRFVQIVVLHHFLFVAFCNGIEEIKNSKIHDTGQQGIKSQVEPKSHFVQEIEEIFEDAVESVEGMFNDRNPSVHMSCSSPGSLDSTLTFHATLKIFPILDSYVYEWYDNATHEVIPMKAKRTSKLTRVYSSKDVSVGVYPMEVRIKYTSSGDMIAGNSLNFTLTDTLNGNIAISQKNDVQRKPNVYAANKNITISTNVTDKFQNANFTYIWRINGLKEGNTTDPVFNVTCKSDGNNTITVDAFAEVEAGSNTSIHMVKKFGNFSKNIEVSYAVNNLKYEGRFNLPIKRNINATVTCTGSFPMTFCYNISDPLGFQIMRYCSVEKESVDCQFTIDTQIDSKGHYILDMSLTNDISTTNNSVKIQLYDPEDVRVIVNSSTPAVLDSHITFFARLVLPSGVSIKDPRFRYIWEDDVRGSQLQVTTDDETSSISRQYHSKDKIKPKRYTMHVTVQNVYDGRIIAREQSPFNLTKTLNTKLNITQKLKYRRFQNTFASNKQVNFTVAVHDNLTNPDISYWWYLNNTQIGFTKEPEISTVVNKSGMYILGVDISAYIDSDDSPLLELHGKLRHNVSVKDTLHTLQLEGVNSVPLGGYLDCRVTCKGGSPVSFCANVTDTSGKQRPNTTCQTTMYTQKCSFPIIRKFTQLGVYKLQATITNDVSARSTVFYVSVYDPNASAIAYIAIPILISLLAAVVIAGGVVYHIKVQRKGVETADFNFHQTATADTGPVVRIRQSLSSLFSQSRSPKQQGYAYASLEGSDETVESPSTEYGAL